MTDIDTNTGAEHLRDELTKVLRRHIKEYNLSYANIVGILQSMAFDLMCVANGIEGEEDEK